MKFKNIIIFAFLFVLLTTMMGINSNFAHNVANAENVYKTNIKSPEGLFFIWPSEIFGGVKSWGTKMGDIS